MEGLFQIPPDLSAEAVQRPFGAASRAELLAEFFGDLEVAPADAWKALYRLLLWTDRSTGLAHCYESDKSQPGRRWYARTMAFHAWVADQLGVPPRLLGDHIDWMFGQALLRLSVREQHQRAERAAAAAIQRSQFGGVELPEPGFDPELRDIFQQFVDAVGGRDTPEHALLAATEAVAALAAAENKRKNLLGEGFEDALAEVMRRLPGGSPEVVESRKLLHELPGFREPPYGEKPRRVDLGIVTSGGRRRVLVSAKWSVRADREEQFGVDFDSYARMEASGAAFDFVLVTNEFDGARLKSACQRRTLARPLFDAVVHVCPDALIAAYGDTARGAAAELPDLIASRRILSLSDWLQTL